MACREETAGGGGGKCPLLANSEPRHRLGQISSGVERREKKGGRRQVRLKEQGGARRAQILRFASRRRTELPGTGLRSSQKCTAAYSSVYSYHPRSLEPGETEQWQDHRVHFPAPWPDGSQPPAPGEPMASSALRWALPSQLKAKHSSTPTVFPNHRKVLLECCAQLTVSPYQFGRTDSRTRSKKPTFPMIPAWC